MDRIDIKFGHPINPGSFHRLRLTHCSIFKLACNGSDLNRNFGIRLISYFENQKQRQWSWNRCQTWPVIDFNMTNGRRQVMPRLIKHCLFTRIDTCRVLLSKIKKDPRTLASLHTGTHKPHRCIECGPMSEIQKRELENESEAHKLRPIEYCILAVAYCVLFRTSHMNTHDLEMKKKRGMKQ